MNDARRPTSFAASLSARALFHLHTIPAMLGLLLAGSAYAEPRFDAIGTLGGDSSNVADLSADGSTIVGSSSNGIFTEAYMWRLGTMTGLGDLGGQYSAATAISADLNSIVGSSDNGDRHEAFLWTTASGLRGLGHTGAGPSMASGVSADGSVVVGTNGMPAQRGELVSDPLIPGNQVVFRWREADGILSLGFIEVPVEQNDISFTDETLFGSGATATGVSADGEILFGNLLSYVSFLFVRFTVLETVPHGFIWTETDGFQRVIAGGSGSDVTSANSDLSVLVGDRLYTREQAGLANVNYVVNETSLSFISATSADGSLLAGTLSEEPTDALTNPLVTAALSNGENGAVGALKPFLFSLGLDLAGWNLLTAEALSADGRVIAGNGVNPQGNEEGWVAQLDNVPAPDLFGVLPSYFYDGLTSAVLPSVRTALPGQTVTVFASIANASNQLAVGCRIGLADDLPITFSYHRTDPATNATVGAQNVPVDIPTGATQSFVIAFTPIMPIPATDLRLVYDCENGNPALFRPTLNSVRLAATETAQPDLVALSATMNNNGVVRVANRFSASAFAVATANVGAAGEITVRPDVGELEVSVDLFVCETDPVSGVCKQSPSAEVTVNAPALATTTFAVFVNADLSAVEFRPDINRVFVRFFDSAGEIRGSTSVALAIDNKRDLPFVAIAAVTQNGDGVLELPRDGQTGAFAASVSNSNVPETVTISASNPFNLAVDLVICATDDTGACIAPATPSLEQSFTEPDQIVSLTVFANATGTIPLSDRNRVFVTVTTPDGSVGERSVQVTTDMLN